MLSCYPGDTDPAYANDATSATPDLEIGWNKADYEQNASKHAEYDHGIANTPVVEGLTRQRLSHLPLWVTHP